jgi:hypothetical protein
MYARGILFGKMKYELGDHSFVRCPENHLVADLEFKTKGYFSGTYNAIGGTIKNEQTGEVYFDISGFWNGEMFLKSHAVSLPLVFYRILGLTEYLDWKERAFIRRYARKAYSAPGTTA